MLPGRAVRATDPVLRAQKQALRARILALRDALPPRAHAQASHAIAERIAALPSLAAATTILATLPFRSEWDTHPLIGAWLARGITVAVPRVDRDARMLVLHAIGDLSTQVVSGAMGLPEPRADLPVVAADAVDWVLVPGVAFDARGRRLGYGGGYYDRLLPAITVHAPRVAGAFDLQVVDDVPTATHDLCVDCIVTERRTLAVDAAR